MTIAYQFGNVGAHSALIRAWSASLGASATPSWMVRVLPVTFGAVRSGDNFAVIYEQANSRGRRVRPARTNMAATGSTAGTPELNRIPSKLRI
jgi:hypothetical protein